MRVGEVEAELRVVQIFRIPAGGDAVLAAVACEAVRIALYDAGIPIGKTESFCAAARDGRPSTELTPGGIIGIVIDGCGTAITIGDGGGVVCRIECNRDCARS